jgi:hypothetical protein
MSRRPRGAAAAHNRITVRLTDTELEVVQRLAAGAGDVSAIVRRLIEEERARTDFVDARHSAGTLKQDTGFAPAHRPAWVYTLHRVPGRAAPLCVRRRVTSICGELVTFELASGTLRSTVSLIGLRDDGSDSTRGYARWDRQDWTLLTVDPVIEVYLAVPTAEERAKWSTRRRATQRALNLTKVWAVVRERLVEVELRSPEVHTEDYRRGDVEFAIEGSERVATFNLFDLGSSEWVTATDWEFTPGVWSYGVSSDVFLEKPSDESVREAVARQREAAEKAQRAAEERARERQRRASAAPGVAFADRVTAALEVLGLEWPCSADDVRRAQRRAATLNHPDRGGDATAMRRVNDAARVVLDFIAEARAA